MVSVKNLLRVIGWVGLRRELGLRRNCIMRGRLIMKSMGRGTLATCFRTLEVMRVS